MQIRSLLKIWTLLSALAAFAAPASAACPPDHLSSPAAAKALSTICTIAALDSIAPDAVRKVLNGRLVLRNDSWSKERGFDWGVGYKFIGDFEPLWRGSLGVSSRPTPDNPSAVTIDLDFTVHDQLGCITFDDLQAAFGDDLKEQLFPPRHPRPGPMPVDLVLKRPNKPSMIVDVFKGCAQSFFFAQSGASPPDGAGRTAYEFITPAMTLDAAIAALAAKGFVCEPEGPGVVAGTASEVAFNCKASLPPNDDGLRSQSVDIYHLRGDQKIRAVLIFSWDEPLIDKRR